MHHPLPEPVCRAVIIYYGESAFCSLWQQGEMPFIPVTRAIYCATVSCCAWTPSLLACNPLLCNMQYRLTVPVAPLKSKKDNIPNAFRFALAEPRLIDAFDL